MLKLSLTFVCNLLMGIALCASAQEKIKIQHGLGETTVNLHPKKVVIFDIGTLETYHELAIPVYGTAHGTPAYLPEYKAAKYLKLGGIKEPDIDAIKAAQPDLIIISGRQLNSYEQLSAIAPTLFLGVDQHDYWASFEKNVRNIAKLHGKVKLAEEKLVLLRQKRDALRVKTQTDLSRSLVLLQVSGQHTAYGSGSRFGFIYDVLGFRLADKIADTDHRGFRVHADYIKQINPQYIFLIDRDSAVGGDQKEVEDLISAEIRETIAYKDDKIIALSGNIWYGSGGGLISVERKISEVAYKLYNL